VQWCPDGDFLHPVFSASRYRMQNISYMHSKFALRPHHVWKYGRHPISEFDFSLVTGISVCISARAKLHHCVKFRRNRSNCGRDIAIFRFSKMAAAAILDFEILTVGTLKRVKHCHCVKNSAHHLTWHILRWVFPYNLLHSQWSKYAKYTEAHEN